MTCSPQSVCRSNSHLIVNYLFTSFFQLNCICLRKPRVRMHLLRPPLLLPLLPLFFSARSSLSLFVCWLLFHHFRFILIRFGIRFVLVLFHLWFYCFLATIVVFRSLWFDIVFASFARPLTSCGGAQWRISTLVSFQIDTNATRFDLQLYLYFVPFLSIFFFFFFVSFRYFSFRFFFSTFLSLSLASFLSLLLSLICV